MRLVYIMTLVFGVFGGQSAMACGADSNCQLGDRHYRIAMPDGHDGATPVGAIVFSHGHRGSAAGVMRNRFMRKMVSDMGLALIATKSKDTGWEIPNAPRRMDSDGIEEFAYFEQVLDDAAARFPIDRDRIVASGFSAGGMMVWNLACARPDLFAGFAPVSGTFWLNPPETCAAPTRSIVHIHGDSDRTVPLTGRKIRDTKQGEVAEALAMYQKIGGFGAAKSSSSGDLTCENRVNSSGDILEFCLFPGGHSYRVAFLKYAWERFEAAGRL